MPVPKVFISYSHDSATHKKWVLDLATRLRDFGIDAILDQWELQAGDDLPHFMEHHLRSADRILMICTEQYVGKANAGIGGVGYEKMIVTSDLLKTIDSNKVIPIVRQHGGRKLPTFLTSKLYLDFSGEGDAEFAFEELVRTLHGAPLYVKPPIGNRATPTASVGSPERTGDPLLVLLKVVVDDFNSHQRLYCTYRELLSRSGMSRVMFDAVVATAKAKRYVTQDADQDLRLTDAGKEYALEHGLTG